MYLSHAHLVLHSPRDSAPLLCNGAFILSSCPVSHRARCPILFSKSIVIPLLSPFPRVYCKSVLFPVFVRLDSSRHSLCHSLPPNFRLPFPTSRCRSLHCASGLSAQHFSLHTLADTYLIHIPAAMLAPLRPFLLLLELLEKYPVCSVFLSATHRHPCWFMLSLRNFLTVSTSRSGQVSVSTSRVSRSISPAMGDCLY